MNLTHFALFVVNFIPAFVAGIRNHHQTAIIFLVCLFFGWTVLGWIAAIAWAMSNRNGEEVVWKTRRFRVQSIG